MSYTLTETIQKNQRKQSKQNLTADKQNLTFDNYKKNKLGDQTYTSMSNQQKQRRRRDGFLKKYENYKNKLKNSNVDEISEKISKKYRSPISDNVEESKEFSNPENLNSEMKKTLENYTLSTMMISFVTLVGMLFL